jgi:hypothetical protein
MMRTVPLIKRKIKTGLIYTMGAQEENFKLTGFGQHFTFVEMIMARIFGQSESLFVYDTYQFDDYSKYDSSLFDVEAKAKRREEQFPKDCLTDLTWEFASPMVKEGSCIAPSTCNAE